MKQYSLKLFLILILAGFACSKNDSLVDPDALEIGSYLTLVKEYNTTFDYAELANSAVSIEVGC